jgi:hypothetical protein
MARNVAEIEEGVSMADGEETQPKAADDSKVVAVQKKQIREEPEDTDADAAGEVTDDSKTVVGEKKPGKHDSADSDDADEVDDEPASDRRRRPARAEARRISVSVRTLLLGMLITGLVAAVGVFAWLYLGARGKLDEQQRQTADKSHAERIALDYAVDAARIDAKNLDAWKKNLVKGTTPELKAKLDEAGKSMEQILTPLQWDSTAVPLVAKVRSNANGIYVVDTFVGVQTKTVQAPDGLQSTATYGITIDSNHGWQISDVGGIGSVVGQK